MLKPIKDFSASLLSTGSDSMPSCICTFFILLTFLLQAFHVHEFFHTMWVLEPKLHADKGLSTLQAQLVPGFGSG